MMKIELMIDVKQKNSSKPTNVGQVSNRLKLTMPTEVSKVVYEVCQPNGRTISNPFKGKRSQDNVTGVTFIGIDFDNPTNDKELGNKIVSNRFTQQYASCVYETFSSTPEKPRYRVLIIPERAITKDEYKVILSYIYNEVYYDLQPDSKVIDSARMFFGSKNTVEELPFSNYTNTLPVSLDLLRYNKKIMLKEAPTKKGVKNPNKTPYQGDIASDNPANLVLKQVVGIANNNAQKAFKEHNIEALKELWSEHQVVGMVLGDFAEQSFLDKLEVLDFEKLLDVDGKDFQDILGYSSEDKDEKPSAKLIRSKNGKYTIYYSHRINRNFNMAQVLIKLGGFKNSLELIKFLEDITNLEFETTYQKDFSSFLRGYRQQLNSILDEKDSEVKKIMDKHNLSSVLDALLDHAFIYAPSKSITGDDKDFTIFATSNQIAKQLVINGQKLYQTSNIANKINQLIKLGLLEKVQDAEISNIILAKLNASKEKFNYSKRSNLYRFSYDLDDDIALGLSRFRNSRHNSAKSMNSYNLDSTLKSKVVSQGASDYASQKALQKAYMIYMAINQFDMISKKDLTSLTYRLTKPFKEKKEMTENRYQKQVEVINGIDQLLKGIDQERCSKKFKQNHLIKTGELLTNNFNTIMMFKNDDFDASLKNIETQLNPTYKSKALEIYLKWSVSRIEKTTIN